MNATVKPTTSKVTTSKTKTATSMRPSAAQHHLDPDQAPDQSVLKSANARSRDRLERALEEGLEDSFPASDAISALQPAPPEPYTGPKKREHQNRT